MGILDVVVITAFTLRVFELNELGRGNIRYFLMIIIYFLFAIAEAWVAVFDGRASYWLFVSLSLFGCFQGVRGYVRSKQNIFFRRPGKTGQVQQELCEDGDETVIH